MGGGTLIRFWVLKSWLRSILQHVLDGAEINDHIIVDKGAFVLLLGRQNFQLWFHILLERYTEWFTGLCKSQFWAVCDLNDNCLGIWLARHIKKYRYIIA